MLQYDRKDKDKEGSARPFWDCAEDIDVAMFGDALVALHRFSTPSDTLKFFNICLEPERSDAVKLVAVKACITLSVEVSFSACHRNKISLTEELQTRTITWQPPLTDLQNTVAERFRNIFKARALS